MIRAAKASDLLTTSTLRSLLARISNAEAIPIQDTTNLSSTSIAGASLGVGTTEMPRKELMYSDVYGVIEAEVKEIEEVLRHLDASVPYGEELRQKKTIIRKYLTR